MNVTMPSFLILFLDIFISDEIVGILFTISKPNLRSLKWHVLFNIIKENGNYCQVRRPPPVTHTSFLTSESTACHSAKSNLNLIDKKWNFNLGGMILRTYSSVENNENHVI